MCYCVLITSSGLKLQCSICFISGLFAKNVSLINKDLSNLVNVVVSSCCNREKLYFNSTLTEKFDCGPSRISCRPSYRSHVTRLSRASIVFVKKGTGVSSGKSRGVVSCMFSAISRSYSTQPYICRQQNQLSVRIQTVNLSWLSTIISNSNKLS